MRSSKLETSSCSRHGTSLGGLHKTSLQCRYDGPFLLVKNVGKVAYKMELPPDQVPSSFSYMLVEAVS